MCASVADDRAAPPAPPSARILGLGGRAQQCVCLLRARSMGNPGSNAGRQRGQSLPLGSKRDRNDSARDNDAITHLALLARVSWNSYDQRCPVGPTVRATEWENEPEPVPK